MGSELEEFTDYAVQHGAVLKRGRWTQVGYSAVLQNGCVVVAYGYTHKGPPGVLRYAAYAPEHERLRTQYLSQGFGTDGYKDAFQCAAKWAPPAPNRQITWWFDTQIALFESLRNALVAFKEAAEELGAHVYVPESNADGMVVAELENGWSVTADLTQLHSERLHVVYLAMGASHTTRKTTRSWQEALAYAAAGSHETGDGQLKETP